MTETSGWLDHHGARLAWRKIAGQGPTLVWLGGFRSQMSGTKAQALADWAMRVGRSFIRFDYFGHGQSSGDFRDGTISRWRRDALAVMDAETEGPLVLIGSSMGGWLACLAALARPHRVRSLVLIAPAADFTSALLTPSVPAEGRTALARDGVWMQPSAYDPAGYPITRQLLEDGATWSLLPGPVALDLPVRILQGAQDSEVPWRHALTLAESLRSDDIIFTLIKDGDHRLSRPQDIARLITVLEEVAEL